MIKYVDGMMGLIVGDALGVPVEFLSREQIANRSNGKVSSMEGYGTFHMPEGTWSDDSSMALATLASIKEKKTIDLDDIMKKFIQWIQDGKYTPFGMAFDIGNTCNEAILNYAMQGNCSSCGVTGEYANGNGALMRILPACVYWSEKIKREEKDILAKAVRSIESVGALTHNHKRSGIACGIYFFIINKIISNGEKKLPELIQEAMDEAFSFYGKDKLWHNELEYYEELLDIEVLSEYEEDELSGSGYVVDSLIASIWCLITTNTYEECVLKAVNLGDDTDTTAAIAGGIAGQYYGFKNIPTSWINSLKGKDLIRDIVGVEI